LRFVGKTGFYQESLKYLAVVVSQRGNIGGAIQLVTAEHFKAQVSLAFPVTSFSMDYLHYLHMKCVAGAFRSPSVVK